MDPRSSAAAAAGSAQLDASAAGGGASPAEDRCEHGGDSSGSYHNRLGLCFLSCPGYVTITLFPPCVGRGWGAGLRACDESIRHWRPCGPFQSAYHEHRMLPYSCLGECVCIDVGAGCGLLDMPESPFDLPAASFNFFAFFLCRPHRLLLVVTLLSPSSQLPECVVRVQEGRLRSSIPLE